MTPFSTLRNIGLVLLILTASSPAPACNLPSELSRIVAKVESADTLRLDDGSEVVLIGSLPPVAPDLSHATGSAWPPAEAARKHLEALVGGKSVDLAFAGRRLDRYGRQLAHVFLTQPVIINQTQSRHWVQGDLLAHGLARAYALPGNAACFDDLIAHENAARANLAGHWSTGVFQDRSAHDPRELTRYRDTFQTIEGRIERVAKVRNQIVFDFIPLGRTAFSVLIAPSTSKTRRSSSALAPESLTGKRVRVRGWIEQHRGPRLTLEDIRHIEILEDPPQSASPSLEDNAATSKAAAIPASHQ